MNLVPIRNEDFLIDTKLASVLSTFYVPIYIKIVARKCVFVLANTNCHYYQ